jgi:hypothetical protein
LGLSCGYPTTEYKIGHSQTPLYVKRPVLVIRDDLVICRYLLYHTTTCLSMKTQ